MGLVAVTVGMCSSWPTRARSRRWWGARPSRRRSSAIPGTGLSNCGAPEPEVPVESALDRSTLGAGLPDRRLRDDVAARCTRAHEQAVESFDLMRFRLRALLAMKEPQAGGARHIPGIGHDQVGLKRNVSELEDIWLER